MVNELKNTFEELLDEATWLTSREVVDAKRKVRAMATNVAYPPNSTNKPDPKHKFSEVYLMFTLI